jgi:hypothetical protein
MPKTRPGDAKIRVHPAATVKTANPAIIEGIVGHDRVRAMTRFWKTGMAVGLNLFR